MLFILSIFGVVSGVGVVVLVRPNVVLDLHTSSFRADNFIGLDAGQAVGGTIAGGATLGAKADLDGDVVNSPSALLSDLSVS